MYDANEQSFLIFAGEYDWSFNRYFRWIYREREEKKKQTNRIITTMIIYLYTKFIEFLHLYVYIILYESTHKTQTLKIA